MKREDAQLVGVAFLAESPSLLKAATTFLVLLLTLLLLFATARVVGLEEGLVVGTTAATTRLWNGRGGAAGPGAGNRERYRGFQKITGR